MRVAVLLCALLLVAHQCGAIRDFGGGGKELHRPVRRWGHKGQTEEKAFDIEKMGRATFDPEFAMHHGDVDRADLGYDEGIDSGEEDEDVKKRLREVFPLLDLNHDGVVDLSELWHWHAENGLKSALRRNEREFNRTDADKDGLVSLKEYMADISEGDEDLSMDSITEIADLNDWLGTIKTAFKLADRDGDGQLNVREYFDFQSPEESDNSKLKFHVTRQDVHLRDDNRDGFLDFDEFFHGYWSSFYLWEQHNREDGWNEEEDKAMARRKFESLDTNGDGQISAEELFPAFDDLHPNERRYAKLQSEHMMEMADTNNDKVLTLNEALQNAHAFYGVTEDDADYTYHDEL